MKSYPLAKPNIGADEERAVLRALRSSMLSMGPEVDAFEKEFARFAGTRHACAVSSGTAGLHLALIGAGIGAGDEVITSPFSFVASANAVLFVGATPVFADIDPLTYNIDPAEIEKKVTKRTKAILVVHIFGQAAEMDRIMRIARKHKLKVIEDACESVGARFRGRPVGTFGESAVFAFYPNKQMTTGEGGMLVTNSTTLDALFRSLRNQGRSANREWLDHERLGYNYRLDEMSAAVGRVQLRRLSGLITKRQRIAEWYRAAFANSDALVAAPRIAEGNRHTWFVYVVQILQKERDRVMCALGKEGISAKPYFPAIHLFSFHRKAFGARVGDFPVTEAVSARSLALPFHVGLEKKDVGHIAGKVLSILMS